LRNQEVSTLTARRELMEIYRRKVIDQMKELEISLANIEHKINYFKNLEASDKQLQDE
jgi:hypothetical protein